MTQRAITSSAITHKGSVIPVKIYTLVASDVSPLSNACADCKGDIGHKNYCKGCEAQEPMTVKAYKISKDEKVILTDDQLTKLKEVDGEIEVLGTVPKSDFDSKLISGAYYLLPDIPKKKTGKSFLKAYGILHSGIVESDRHVIVRFSVRTKERLGVIQVQGNVLVLLAIAYNDQVRDIENEPQFVLSDEEIKMGKEFVNKLEKTDLTQIANRFTERLEKIIEGADVQSVTESDDSDDGTGFFK
jgi:DNA end-binding protein Ku